MLKPYYTNKFKKQYDLMKKRGLNILLLNDIMSKLIKGEKLPSANRDHELKGNYNKSRECHIQPDWLLVYYIKQDVITFEATGSHSDLF